MIPSRESEAARRNPKVREENRRRGETNSRWVARVTKGEDLTGWVLLVGGSGLTGFRLRVAQSHARRDLLPSFWSHAALIAGRARRGDWLLHEVSLEPAGGFGQVPASNGVQESRLSAYDDPGVFPNLACLRFSSHPKRLLDAMKRLRKQRIYLDVPSLIVDWLAFVWGAGEAGNPLLKGTGVPSAAFVEGVFALADLELTPGLSSRSSCPEAIWQSAIWWHDFHKSAAVEGAAPPDGVYIIGQPAAAAET